MREKLTNKIESIEIFYDGNCAMCCNFVTWLKAQPRAVDLYAMPYQSAEAQQVFANLKNYNPELELISRINKTEVYRGAESWVWCLWSCKNYQWLAKLLSQKTMMHWAKKVCYSVAKNRFKLSNLIKPSKL